MPPNSFHPPLQQEWCEAGDRATDQDRRHTSAGVGHTSAFPTEDYEFAVNHSPELPQSHLQTAVDPCAIPKVQGPRIGYSNNNQLASHIPGSDPENLSGQLEPMIESISSAVAPILSESSYDSGTAAVERNDRRADEGDLLWQGDPTRESLDVGRSGMSPGTTNTQSQEFSTENLGTPDTYRKAAHLSKEKWRTYF